MTKNKTAEEHYNELKRLLHEAHKEIKYFQNLAIESGRRTIREINQLSQLFSEQKKTEEKLKESEEKYRTIVENINDIVYSSSSDGVIYFVSHNVFSLTGYKPEEIIGKSILEFVHPDDRGVATCCYKMAAETKEEFSRIYRLMKNDGDYYYVEELSRIIREHDNIVGITGVLRDITESRQVEKALRESEIRFRSLFEAATEFIHILDNNGIILQTNKIVYQRSDYSEEEMIGHKLTEFLTPESQKVFKREFPMLLKKSSHHTEIEFVCKDGTVIISECSCMVVRDTKGKFINIVTFLHDITQRKKTEENLKRAQKELEIKTKNIEETNIALKVLLKHQDTEIILLEKNILSSIKTLVIPYLDKIKMGASDERLLTYIHIIETNLAKITKPFAPQLTDYHTKLSPAEIQIADLIRENKTSKEIAEIFNISETTVFFHRRNIRMKLGIKNKKNNLRSYLQSMTIK